MLRSNAPFTLKILFFKSISTSDRKRLMELQRDEWSRKLEERQHYREQLSRRSEDHYRSSLLERSIKQLARDITWIQDLIKGEKQP